MWPFSKSEPAAPELNRKKDGRTSTGFMKKGTINTNARKLMEGIEEDQQGSPAPPKKKR